MAVNDVTIIFSSNLAAAGQEARQPGSGVEELLLMVAIGDGNDEGSSPDKTLAVQVNIKNEADQAESLDGDAGDMAGVWFKTRMTADNTNTWAIENRGGATLDLSFAVMQIG